ncbi:putative pentatricopeptide repeat-containing protein At5g52630 [Rhododendron vialii]|uniref:putative pentatricopeptide repeat-containing protein At5g52630 n=1 Tax=Rhododendron vialii TaxID=182163 RepID=UPI00265E90C7|nr:putative pentatricopeptide repeat-containing protein At5g52630 [Rhododendron vialii]
MLHPLPLKTTHQQTQLQIPLNNRLSNQFIFEQNYRNISNLLLSLTRSRTLPKGLQVHAHIIKTGFQAIPLISHYLINFYSKTQLPLDSQRVFEETQVKSSTSWSSVISCFAQNELPCFAIEFFRRMLGFGVRPDDRIFPSTMKASGMLSWREFGRSVHCLALKTGFDADVFVGSSVVDMYAKCGEIRDARTVFDGMPVRNVVSWGGMICGYTQLGEDEEALRLFKQALWEGLDVNDFTFSSVIRVCGNSTLLELGKQIHGLCLKTSYDSSSFVGSSLVALYSKCGVIEGAYQVFEEIPERNLGMWNAMLIACAQHAHIEKAFDLFKQMESVCMKPNFITFLCVLYACSHAGLVEEGKHYFELMKVYGIEPGDQHYASMVDLLGRAGRLQDAVSIINEMPIKPTESVWGALLTSCRIHKDTELAVYAANRVFELGQVSSGMHLLLANAYAAAGRYEDAAKARKMLRDRGVKKETGLSWVEQGNCVHTFAAGDRRHPISCEIYQKLKVLGEEMERAGYVADTSFVLREVDSDEKNQAIRYHSERLAIAFGLITFPPERPIRVMKNLRVCGDCHTAIKFMSMCTGRVIIVRDNNRFHRFEDGKCSCGDYW